MKNKIAKFLCFILATAFTLNTAGASAPFTALAASEKFELKPVGEKTAGKVEFNYDTQESLVGEMKQYAENSNFKLLVHEKNLSIALVSKKDGRVYTSNPYNAAKQPAYNGNNKKQMDSQIVIDYDDYADKRNSLWSASDCAELGQFEIKPIKNGAEIRYSIGVEKTVELVPAVISKADFEAVIEKLEKEGSSRGIRRLKILYNRDKYKNGEIVYKVKKLNPKEKKEVEGYFISGGYTEKDFEADRNKYKSEVEAKYFPNFQLDVEYRINKNGLSVNIPGNSIRYDKSKFKLINIKLLEFFGAADVFEDKNGFVFLPDGSGAIIPFENRESTESQAMVYGKVFGTDNSVTKTVEMFSSKQYYLPIFGLAREDGGYLAIIKEGAAVANVFGYSANNYSKYFSAFSKFDMVDTEKMELEQKVATHGSESKVTVYDENAYKGDIRVDYSILSKENASLTGMADIYRNYLFELGMNSKFGVEQDFLTIETLGTLNYTDNILGIKYSAAAKLTEFDDSCALVEKLKKNGISDISLILSAWRKGGLDSGIANSFNPSKAIGGKSGFDRLYSYCKSEDVMLYPDLDILNITVDKIFDGFNPRKDATRLLNKEYGGKKIIDLDTGLIDKEKFSYALSPSLYKKTVDKFLKNYNKKYSNIGLSTVGRELNSNFKKDNLINRAQSLEMTEKMLRAASKKNKLMFSGANSYCLPYANFIEKLPLSGSEAKGTVSVPFVQILLNGYVKYSSEELNYESDYKKATLKCIESASAPHYVLATDNIIKIKETDYTEFYSVDANTLFDTVKESYKAYEKAINPVKGSKITDYRIMSPGIVKVSYENGYCIVLNYTEDSYTCSEGLVEPMSSITVKEAKIIEQ